MTFMRLYSARTDGPPPWHEGDTPVLPTLLERIAGCEWRTADLNVDGSTEAPSTKRVRSVIQNSEFKIQN